MDKRKPLSEIIREIISLYAADEIESAEKKLSLYPAWRRYLAVMDDIFECSFRDPYADHVQGGESIPQAERIIILKEGHSEYQRVLRNISKIDDGLVMLTYQELQFVEAYWWDTARCSDHWQDVADIMGWGRRTVGRWKKRCIRKMMPYLEDVDGILIRARYADEWSRERKSGTCSATPNRAI